MFKIHPGKELDSLKDAIYSFFTLDVIAILKEEQK